MVQRIATTLAVLVIICWHGICAAAAASSSPEQPAAPSVWDLETGVCEMIEKVTLTPDPVKDKFETTEEYKARYDKIAGDNDGRLKRSLIGKQLILGASLSVSQYDADKGQWIFNSHIWTVGGLHHRTPRFHVGKGDTRSECPTMKAGVTEIALKDGKMRNSSDFTDVLSIKGFYGVIAAVPAQARLMANKVPEGDQGKLRTYITITGIEYGKRNFRYDELDLTISKVEMLDVKGEVCFTWTAE